MTPKQEKFIQKYAEHGNATQAYKEAGFKVKNDAVAGVSAHRMLKSPKIKAAVDTLRAQAAEAAGVSTAWVLERLKAISDRCMTAVPVMRFDPVEKAMVQDTVLNEFQEEVGVFKFDSAGANKATELLGKHMGFFDADNAQRKPNTSIKVGYGKNEAAEG